MIRLLICDDSADARSLLRTMLSGHPEIEIVGEAAGGSEAVALAVELSPDAVLMDVAMAGVDGVSATRRIRELCPTARIVAFAGSDEHEAAQAMLEAGASAYCVKGGALWELEQAIAGASRPLLRLAHVLARSVSEGGVADLVAREVAELTGAVLAAVYLAAPDAGLSVAATAGPAAPEPGSGASSPPGVAVRAHAEAEAVRADRYELAEFYTLFAVPCSEALAVPLRADGERLGVLLAVMPANVQFEVDTELLLAVADLAAPSLANERRLALSYAESRRDALTGLGNRRAFDEHLDRVLREALEGQRSAALVVLDLDDLKQTNDEGGYAAGDRALIVLGRVLLGSVRANEEVFRIGGDEFALVVHGDETAAARAAERLQAAVRKQRRADPLPTFSAGIASCPAHATTTAELVRTADAALSGAKRAGKNRVEVYEGGPSPQEPELPAASPGVESRPSAGLELVVEQTGRLHILVVDDDPSLRMLLRTTFEIIDIEVDEADSATAAEKRIAVRRPDVIVLDVALPEVDGISFCRQLKADRATAAIPVVLLTGFGAEAEAEGRAAGADEFLRKPFSPLELLGTVERVAGRLVEGPFRLMTEERPGEQLLLYAQDLRQLLEIERSQRLLLQTAYQETVTALARALESKDFGTGSHSQRVSRYASELTRTLDPALLEEPSLEFGFLLHDIGKIGIPDSILLKPGPLTSSERRLMETHAVLGEQILQKVALLEGEGLRVIRFHHERWDGHGYPDRLGQGEIPLGARIFAVADALDAITTNRPYRRAGRWHDAVQEIVAEASHQFDPAVVEAFRECEPKLRRIYFEVGAV